MEFKWNRPIVFFDLETTGVNVKNDRIVEMCFIKYVEGTEYKLYHLVNPLINIPSGASNVHGITNDKIKDEKTFGELAESVKEFISGCDLAGYNSNSYDIPLLKNEFIRNGIDIDLDTGIKKIDCFKIFKKMFNHKLHTAYGYYTGKELNNAHSAEADIYATVEILQEQMQMYNIDEKECVKISNGIDPDSIDKTGKFKWNDKGQPIITFGKHSGMLLTEMATEQPGYLRWILGGSNMDEDTRCIARDALSGIFPSKNKNKEVNDELGI